MKIAKIKELDKGMGGISCEGVVKYSKSPKCKNGETNGKLWSFWSQFIVVEDDTDSIGVWLTLDAENDAVANGAEVLIGGCVLDTYQKEGKTEYSLNKAKIVGAAKKATNPVVSNIATGNKTSDSETLRIRSMAWSYGKDVICEGKAPLEDWEKLADRAIAWIYQQPSPEPKTVAENFGDPAMTEDDIPF